MTAPPADARPDVPDLVVLDVNETLSDLGGLATAFGAVGLDPRDVEAWFAGVLRDAFALTVLGDNPRFAEVAAATLRARLVACGSADPDAAAAEVLQALVALRPHPDVVPGLVALAALGCRVVTLSNGSASVARTLLRGTDAEAVVEDYLTVEDARRWKPAPEAYEHALATTGVTAQRALLVAVHPWDLEGAHRAGLRTAWLDRSGRGFPSCFTAPDLTADGLVGLAERLGPRA